MSFKEYLLSNTSLLERTAILYDRTIKRFLREYDEATAENINKFIIDSSKNKRSLYVKYAFKYYLRYINKEEIYDKLISVKKSMKKKQGTYLSRKELMKIVNGIENKSHKIVALIQFLTGARAHDVLSIRSDEVKKDEEWMGKGVLQIRLRTKVNKERYVFIGQYYSDRIWYFIKKRNKKYPFLDMDESEDLRKAIDRNYRYYYNSIKKSAKKCGYENFATHDFRRNFANDVYEKETKDIRYLANALGVTETTALIYIKKKLEKDKAREIMMKIRP